MKKLFMILSLFLSSKTMAFSPVAFCRSITFTQSEKASCLLNFGFKLPKRAPIRIAVVDTGVDRNHFYLNRYMVNLEGLDSTMDKNPFLDEAGHGTHVAGIIVSELDEIMDSSKIIVLFELISTKWISNMGLSPALSSTMLEAVSKQKFDIMNVSSVGRGADFIESSVLAFIIKNGTQVVSSAGNEGEVADNFFPCAYPFKDLICVGWLNQEELSQKSNFGSKVDVAVEATSIFSSLPNNRFGYQSGTSMAAPRITALLAFLKFSTDRYMWSRDSIAELTNQKPPNKKYKSALISFPKLVRKIATVEESL